MQNSMSAGDLQLQEAIKGSLKAVMIGSRVSKETDFLS